VVPLNEPHEDLDRFLQGCRIRDEVALVVVELFPSAGTLSYGNPNTVTLRPIGLDVTSTPMPSGVSARLAPGLRGPDKDLAIRIKNMRPPPDWMRVVDLIPKTEGELTPLLVDSVEAPLAQAWVTADGHQRWYLVPPGCDWSSLLSWIAHNAVPVFTPSAIYRVRPTEALPPELLTPEEEEAREQIDELESQFAATRERLQQDMDQAAAIANKIRAPLLFGRDDDLKRAVAAVLDSSGFMVEDLDELGGTWSADLLAESDDGRWLVEVTSSSGNPSEEEWGKLKGHMGLWLSQRPDQPLDGGVLIVNNNKSMLPTERPTPFSRRAFLDALDGPVIGTVALFRWWRDSDFERIRKAVSGPPAVF
jgi:hypothetical protein